MPRSGDVDQLYPTKLLDIGIRLLDSFRGAKNHHRMQCTQCLHEWVATPVAKIQAFKKYNRGGCPQCTMVETNNRQLLSRKNNISTLLDKGFEILSDWDGRNSVGATCTPLPVTVKNTKCGHTFTSNAVNLLRRHVDCPICAQVVKNQNINDWSKRNSELWQETASDWKIYKSRVTALTRAAYAEYKHIINPNNLIQGKAGIEGAHHLDHIVPIRYCFDNLIPEEICGHHTNLQMLGWRENVGSRDKLKENINIPIIFKLFIKE